MSLSDSLGLATRGQGAWFSTGVRRLCGPRRLIFLVLVTLALGAASAARADFMVTPTAGANGFILPDVAYAVPALESAVFLVAPDDAYATDPEVGGTCPQGSWDDTGLLWTTGPITADCTVAVFRGQFTY